MPFKRFFQNTKNWVKHTLYAQVLVVVLAFALMVFLSYYFMSNIERQHLISDVDNAILNTHTNIVAELLEPETMLDIISENVLHMLLEGDGFDLVSEYVTNITERILSNERHILYVTAVYGVLDIFDGRFYTGVDWTPPDDYIPKERLWYKAAIEAGGEVVYTEPYLDAMTGVAVMTFTRCLLDDEGRQLGVVCLDISLDKIKEYAVNTHVTEGSYGILLDSQFVIFAHPNQAYIGKTLQDFNVNPPIESELREGKNIVERKAFDYNGEPSVLFVQQLENGWYMAVMAYAKEHYQSVKNIARILTALGAVLSIIFSAILIRIIREKYKSDARIQAIHNAMPLCTNIWSKNLELIDCNEEAVKLFELSGKKELLSNFKKISPEYQPDGRLSIEKAFEFVKEAFEKGYCRFEWLHQKMNGDPIPCDITLIRIDLNNTSFVAAYMQDLRELKSSAEKMREANERTQIIFDTAPAACCMFDKNFNIFDCNQETVKLFGLPNKQVFIDEFYKLSPEYQPCGRKTSEMAFENNNKTFTDGYNRFEWMHQTLSGEPVPCEIIQVRVKFRDEYVAAGYIRDLREQKALLNKLNNEHEKTRNMAHWYESILDTIPFLVSVTDANMNLTFINKATENYLEVNRNNVIGQHCSIWKADICHTDACGIARLKQGFKQTHFKQRGASFQVDGDILKNLDGETIGYVEVVQDISEMENKNVQLGELSHWYQTILDTLPFPISVTDANMVSTFVNKALENDYGVNRTTLVGQQCCGIQSVLCKTGDCGIARLRRNLRRTYFQHKGLSFQLDTEFLRDLNGEISGHIEIVHDITQLEKITKKQAEAEAANAAKSMFLARVSHEIRTPMNAILGITEIQLQNEDLPKDAQEAMGTIYNSGYLLLGIINDILDLSKIEAGKLELSPVNYDVASLINDTVHLNIMRYDSKPIDFKLNLDKNIPSTLFGDDLRIKQILNNLLSNAFKYTDSGEIIFSMSIEPYQLPSAGEAPPLGDKPVVTLVLSVKDTGQGMKSDQVDKLFDEYTRFNTDTNRTTMGTGLGMTITKHLVQTMNGVIFVESEPDEGSLFTVKLPQGKVDEGVLGEDLIGNLKNFRVDRKSQMKKAPQIIREYMPYGSVLIVDDVETNLYVAKGLLTPYGLTIETASSGFEAIDKIKSGASYDIIFMDHFMPKMDGMEAANIIRSFGYANPIIALTANALAGQAENFIANGFDGFISKPIDIRQLNASLNKFVRDKYPNDVIQAARLLKDNMDKQSAARTPRSLVTLELAGIFIRDAERTIAALEAIHSNNYRRADDIQTYIINVHAMKSALANIGESELSEFARKLEVAGREENLELIKNESPTFVDSLQKVIKKLRPKEDDHHSNGEESFLREKLAVIETACKEYDIIYAKDAMAELRQKTWSASTRESLDAIAEHLLHSAFEKAAEIVGAMLS